MKTKLMLLLKILILPLVLILNLFQSSRSTAAKCFFAIGIILILGSAWAEAAQAGIEIVKYNLFQWGMVNRITSVHVIGTSMLPTIRSGETVSLDSPRKFVPEKGDIVSFKNVETGAYSYIKRVIGTPGDTVSIRNGKVVLNGNPISEPYTYKSLPTFGNTFLAECEPVTVPEGNYFVMGDNRTVSVDSRVLGFVGFADVDGVIKTGQSAVPDSEGDSINFSDSFDKTSFVKMLNEKRKNNNHERLISSEPLEKVALMRAEEIRDHYGEWKMASRKLETLLDEEKYSYNMAHEYVTFGYLNETEVINQIFESFVEKEIFLSDKYLEVGVGVVRRSYNGCEYPIITIILTWPTKPTYDASSIEYWQNQDVVSTALLTKLNVYYSNKSNGPADRELITKAAALSEISARIAGKMSRGEWLNSKDSSDMKIYEQEFGALQDSVDEVIDGDGAASKPSTTPIKCESGTKPYLSHCSCEWVCVAKAPEMDCMRVCPQDEFYQE